MATRQLWWTALLILLVPGEASAVAPPVCLKPSAAEVLLGSSEKCAPLRRSLGYWVGVIEGDEVTLAKAVNLVYMNKEDYVAMLFYASWCPFSQECMPHFETLAYLFPTIRHFAFEESAVRPSMTSLYGINGYPTLFLVNSTMRVRYHGPRTVKSLAAFYSDVSGVRASMDSTIGDVIPSSDTFELKKGAEQDSCAFWWACLPEKIFRQDTYLAPATAFVILRLLYLLFPTIVSLAKGAWRKHTLFANLMDVHQYFFIYLEQGRQKFKRVYPSKRGNLHDGARNATSWASKSLASVSIGDSGTSLKNSAKKLT